MSPKSLLRISHIALPTPSISTMRSAPLRSPPLLSTRQPPEEASSSAQVTNYHVIRNAKAAKVAVTDGGRTVMYDASLVGYNPDKVGWSR